MPAKSIRLFGGGSVPDTRGVAVPLTS